jgi:SAUR family protein
LINANFQGLNLSINWKHATSSNQIHHKDNQTYPTDKDRDTIIIMDQKKSNKIREIVRLQQILKKWRRIANSSKTTTTSTTTNNNITSSKSMKFLKRTLSLSEREGTTITSSNNGSVPKGYLAVCVGEELKRFIIPTEYLGHQAFQILLREAEEEFGFQQTGVLRIPCEVNVFESILKMVEDGKKNDKFSNQECRSLSIEEMMGFCSLENQLACSHHPQSPLCR